MHRPLTRMVANERYEKVTNQPSAVKSEQVLRSIGDRLKKARESKNLTLDQARIKTRIHPKILTALEEGSIDEVLGQTYARGFLKKYAAFLGLDCDEILKEYLVLHSEARGEGAPSAIPDSRAYSLHMPPALRVYGSILLLAAVAVLALVLLIKGCRALSRVHDRARTKVASTANSKTKVPVAMKATPAAKKSSSSKTEEQTKPSINISKNEPLVLTFGVKRPVYVKVSKDGVVLFERELRERTVETVRAEEKINLRVANIEALELYLNGIPLAIHKKGEIKNLEITRRGFKIK